MRERRLAIMHNVIVGYADDYALNSWLSVIPADGETPKVFKKSPQMMNYTKRLGKCLVKYSKKIEL